MTKVEPAKVAQIFGTFLDLAKVDMAQVELTKVELGQSRPDQGRTGQVAQIFSTCLDLAKVETWPGASRTWPK